MKGIAKHIKGIWACLIAVTLVLSMASCNSKKTSDKIIIWAFDYYIDAAKEAVKEYKAAHCLHRLQRNAVTSR